MEELLKIIYIQDHIIKYNNDYVISDYNLSKLLNVNIKKIIKKYKLKVYKHNKYYLLNDYSLVIISIITNKVEKCFYIFKALQLSKNYSLDYLNKIKIVL